MATRLKFPRGSTAYFLLAFTRDGAALDLTGATLAATVRQGPDEAAELFAPTCTVLDALAGLAQVQFLAASTAALPRAPEFYWRVSATFPTGDVIIGEAHHGPLVLTPSFSLTAGADCCAGEPPVEGVTATLEAGGTITLLPPAMANYVLNRYDLTGLTGGTTAKLDGLSAATLTALQNGAIVRLFFTGSIMADFRLRANTGAETESAPWRIICDQDTTRLFELLAVWKQGTPCLWVSSLAKFKQILESGGAIALADNADAFVLP